MRTYKSGTRWCLWRWTNVHSEYIVRLHLIKTPWFAVCLHWLKKPDPEPFLHDHPVTFLSVILRGGYTERRLTRRWALRGVLYRLRRRHWYNYIRAEFFDHHRIVSVKPHTLTLCFMGPKRREWGYHTPVGWVYWKDYERDRLPGQA